MNMRTSSAILLMPLLLAWGCRPAPRDTSRVIASAGGHKITEQDFTTLVNGLSPDGTQAHDFLTNPADRERRAELVNQMAMQEAILSYAHLQGLDKDPIVRRQVEGAEAQAYFQAMVQKRLQGLTPTDAELKAFYDSRVAAMKAQGQDKGIPAFEVVKPQLPALWRQDRGRQIAQELQQEIRSRVPITLADDYKPAVQQ